MSDFDWEYEATDVIAGGERIVAKFENYHAAVFCLPALSRILRLPLGIRVRRYGPAIDIPKGCYVGGFGRGETLHFVTR